jgi:hypothetical protein
MDEMIDKKSWEEFRDSGLLWFVNSILQVFGWSIITEYDKDTKHISSVYPARTKFRGFDNKTNDIGYVKVSEYMKENADTLLQEAKE